MTSEILENNYQIVFSDEFNGTQLDPAKWITSLSWGPYLQVNDDKQIYLDVLGRNQDSNLNPITVSGGSLKITADDILSEELPVQEEPTSPIWQEFPSHQYSEDYLTTWIPSYGSGVVSSSHSFKIGAWLC